MKLRRIIALIALALAAPLHAERLQFDYRLYPPLKAVLDSGDEAMLYVDNADPQRLVDLIAVRGKSAAEWGEALEIVSVPRPKSPRTARDGMEALRAQALARCPATFEVIAEDANSITFARRSPDCPAERARFALYRLVAGKRSWFQLTVLSRGELSEEARRQWLQLLASASLG